ncbi:hypothetical protein J6590_053672 [Homalodisca vitripennis]|nr:hypothetical protein J6590_053672 [Homalodisca vitripennis]
MVGVSCASGSVVASPLVPSPAFINTVPYAVPPYATRVDLVTRGLKTPFLPAPAPYLPPSAVFPRLLPSPAVLPAPAFPRVVPPHALPAPVLPPRVLPSPILPPAFPPRFPSPFLPAPYFPNFYGGTPFPTSFSGPFTIPGALFPPFFYRRPRLTRSWKVLDAEYFRRPLPASNQELLEAENIRTLRRPKNRGLYRHWKLSED